MFATFVPDDFSTTPAFDPADPATWPSYDGRAGICLFRRVDSYRATATTLVEELVARPDGRGGVRLERTTSAHGAERRGPTTRPFDAADVEAWYGEDVAARLAALLRSV